MKKIYLFIIVCLAASLAVACQAEPATTGGTLPTSTVVAEATETMEPTSTPEPAASPTTATEQEVAPTKTPEALPSFESLPGAPLGTPEAAPTEAAGEDEGSTASIPDDLSDVIITMQRTPCFGTCPAYTLTIEGDGTVQYVGENFVEVEGEQTAQISEEQVRQLVQAFYDADFFNMQDRYEDNVTDLPSTTTTITIGGETKSVYNYYGAPEALHQLEDTIDDISGAAEWVGGNN